MDTEVFVKLTDEQRQERHASILFHLGEAERLEAKKKAEAKATQELIDHEWSECYRLRRVLLDDAEARRQGDLRFGDEVVPSTDEAKAALAAVAKAAGDEGETKPTEPHVFSSTGTLECNVCGAPSDDPVHDVGAVLPHVFSPAPETDSSVGIVQEDVCTFQGCGRGEGDPIHDLTGEPRILGADFGSKPSVSGCPACAAGTCGVHPHAFVDGGEPENKCAGCGKGRRARVHEFSGDEAEPNAPGEGEAPGLAPEERAEEREASIARAYGMR